jgi:hypothetical protein
VNRRDLAELLGVELIDVDGCWLPDRRPRKDGYVRLYRSGIEAGAHRWALLVVGRIRPDELKPGRGPGRSVVDHLCRQRACCRPSHLELVSDRTNVLRGLGPTAENARKGYCSKGHPFAEGNLVGVQSRRERRCRACDRDYSRNYDRNRRKRGTK